MTVAGTGPTGRGRIAVFWTAVVALLAALIAGAPIPQAAHYHAFADVRPWLGVPHAWNVLSNLPFVFFGTLGLAGLRGRRGANAARPGWHALFAGSLLVGFGSAWYHLDPSDASLTWDRLAMAVAFAGLFSALVAEYVDARWGRRLLWPGLVFAVGAVAWWRIAGDLSLWIWVQAAPMLAILLVVGLFRPGADRRWLLGALACYVFAKVFEVADASMMDWLGGLTGGHAFKHVAAGLAVACFHALLGGRGRGA